VISLDGWAGGTKDGLLVAANLLFAYAFLMSARVKWDNPDDFSLYLNRSFWARLPFRAVTWLSYAVLGAESVLVLTFGLNIGAPYRQVLALLLLASFTAFLVWNRLSTGEEECSCFGEGSKLNRYPIARNLVLAALVLVTLVFDQEETPALTVAHGALFVFAALAEFAFVGYWRHRKNGQGKGRYESLLQETFGRPILFLSYKLRGVQEADSLLGDPSSLPIVVVLEAPAWLTDSKRQSWTAHRVVDASSVAPGPVGAPFLLIRDGKSRFRRYAEWEGYLRRYFAESRS